MGSLSVRTTVVGLSQVVINISGVSRRIDDLSPALKRSAVLMHRSINENFRSSGRPAPWRPLSFGYLKRKVAQGYSPKPLLKTGQLRNSITSNVERLKFSLGTAVKYAPYHQFGTATIPARPFLNFQSNDISRINRLVAEYILDGKNG